MGFSSTPLAENNRKASSNAQHLQQLPARHIRHSNLWNFFPSERDSYRFCI